MRQILLIFFVSLYICCNFVDLVEGGKTGSRITPEKALKDDREYRIIRLDNGLEVLLISDNTTEKSSAAMDVGVGFRSDPEKIPGLAHLCEHMLFQGSKKYPESNGFQYLIKSNGGIYNAFTTDSNTNYHFDILNERFQEALDRFAHFFIDPLFNENSTLSEVNAVNSEHDMNINNDARREFQVLRDHSNFDHPFHKFGTGTYKTLYEIPKSFGINLRNELIKFYNSTYSAHIMKLSILGKESLDQLEIMVNKTFSLITGKEVNIPVFTNPFFITNLAKITYIVPYKDMHVLNIYFPIEEILQSKYYSQKPFDYISNLIGHEGPGSILSFLKKNGWGQGISAGTFYEIDFSLFVVKIKLTATGIEHIYDILNVFFDYIHLIKQKGINEWYFDELKEMSRIEFDYESKEEPYAATTNTASNMQLFAPEDVLTGNRLYITYYPDLINQVLDKINPYNMRVHCIASKFKELPNLETEQYYGTQFVEQLIDKNNLLSWNITRQQSSFGLYLPSKNPYIPQNLTVLSDPNPTALPEAIRSDELLGLYHKLDVSFGRPESAWEVLLSSPYIFDSAADYMLASLLVSTYRDSINDKLYYASIAGLDYSINTSPSGIRISISGFSQKQGDLIFEIVSGLFYFKATPDRFNTLKDELIRILQNFDLASPYQYSDFLSDIILQHPSYLPDDFLDILPVLNLDDMESYMDRIFSRIKLDIFAHGNIEKKDVLLITTRLITNVTENSNYHLNALLSTEVNLQRTIALPFGINYFYKIASPSPSEVSNAVKLYYQIGTSDTLASTVAEFFSYMISEPFFDKLRTKENLGYVVFAKYDPLSAVDGVSFIIQSPKTPDFVDVKISAWLENDWSSFLYDMSQYTFQNYQTSFANLLTEKPKSLSDKTSRYWKEIELRRFQWDRSEAQAEYVMTLSKRTIQLFTEKYFWRESPYMRKLSVYVYLNNATTNMLSMNDTKNKKLIRDLDAFKQRSNLFTALPWLQDNGGPAPTKNEVGMETYDLFPCEPEYKDPNEFFNTNTNNDFGSTIGYCSNRKHCVVCDNDDSSLCMRET